MMPFTVSIQKAKGYERGGGKYSKKSWVAAIDRLIKPTDKDPYPNREFLEPSRIDWGDSELYRKAKGVWTEIYELDGENEAIYEVVEFGEHLYLMVFFRESIGEWRHSYISKDRVWQILDCISAGKSFNEARLATAPPQKESQHA